MTEEAASERPKFTGASLYNHPSGLLSFWYASDWTLDVAPSALPSVTIYPDEQDPATKITIIVRDIHTPLATSEHSAIIEGIREGVAQLDGYVLDSLVELDEPGRWGVEWQCSFLANGQRRRRRARLFFSNHYQYAVILDGSTEERYCYWQGMMEFTMLTVGTAPFNLIQALQSGNSSNLG